jgi:CRP-like cAMP-binding protein
MNRLLRTLEYRDRLTSEEREAVLALRGRPLRIQRGHEIVAQASRPENSCLILEGFAVRSQTMLGGSRQFASVHVPGDFVDLHCFTLKVLDHSVVALNDCHVVFIPHTQLRDMTERFPHVARLLWLLTTIDAAIQRTWITCLGRRSAPVHLAHLICELYERLRLAGLAREDMSFDFPATQVELADMLGLSTVHVNRSLRDLRRTGLVRWQEQRVTILDMGDLQTFAEFDPLYLNLLQEPR